MSQESAVLILGKAALSYNHLLLVKTKTRKLEFKQRLFKFVMVILMG